MRKNKENEAHQKNRNQLSAAVDFFRYFSLAENHKEESCCESYYLLRTSSFEQVQASRKPSQQNLAFNMLSSHKQNH